jgi:GR25 family glycosyltransferase involved in LPS biosynthesis
MLNIDKVYIAHWDKLTERKKIVQEQFDKHKIKNVAWVESFDKENWDRDVIEREFPNIFKMHPSGVFLNKSVISLALKHCWILEDAYKNNLQSILVFEDDIILHDDFVNLFNNYASQLPSDWDICFVGSCCGLHAKYDGVNNVYKHNLSRCTHAYMVSNQGLKKMIPHIRKINDAIDWVFNHFIKDIPLNNYWFEPSIVEQNKNFQSTVQY